MRAKALLGLFLVVLGIVPVVAHARVCFALYEPVCGEDGQRYTNACFASDAHTRVRRGGALIKLEDPSGSFYFWSQNDRFIDEAVDIVNGASPGRVPVFNDLSAGPDCSQPHRFQVDPADMVFADAAVEVCDATAAYIDRNLDTWLEDVDQWCPWSAEIVEVWDYR